MMAAKQNPSEFDLSDEQAAERMRMIYHMHSRVLMRKFLSWTLGDVQRAEDLMQETMLRTWRHLPNLDIEPARLRAWLFTVGRRIAIDGLRTRAIRPPETEAEELEHYPLHFESYERVLDRSVIREAVSDLPTEHLMILSYVYLLDLSVVESSRRLGIPEGTAKSRLHHALRAVRAKLATEAEDWRGQPVPAE